MDRIYARISLETERSGSVAKQLAALRRAATGKVAEYVDRSTSGAVPFAERPEGARLLAALQPGDRVLVTKVDRCSRSTRDLLGLVERVETAGATITFTEQGIATEGPTGRFVLTLLGALAEMERALIAERRRESLEAFNAEGRHAVGRAPFGLRSVPNPNGRGLVLRPDPDEAPTLRGVVESLLEGQAQARLAPLVGMGEPAFSRLLRNERLAGILGYDADGVPRLDPDMAVFDLTEWERLQAYLSRPAKAWSKAEGYGAALACSECGDRLYLNVAARKPQYATYRCRKVKQAHKGPGAAVGASVIRNNADAFMEKDFLARFGAEPVIEEVTVSSDAVRTEAISVARLRLTAARRAQDAARTPEEEDTADEAYRAARRALRDAEELPSETVVEARDTGMDHAELWEMLPDSERGAFLAAAGRWVVRPGRLPIEEKLQFRPKED